MKDKTRTMFDVVLLKNSIDAENAPQFVRRNVRFSPQVETYIRACVKEDKPIVLDYAYFLQKPKKDQQEVRITMSVPYKVQQPITTLEDYFQ